MIADLDRTLEQLFKMEFGTPLPFDLSFAIPDRNFAPASISKNTLDCFLYDIRENRELRTVEPLIEREAGGVLVRRYAPPRMKVSYCITAWSPAQLTPGTEPALDEHALLGDVLRALLKYPTLPEGVLMGTLADQHPPVAASVVSPGDRKANADFWNAVGGQLRPSLDYEVTISLAYEPPSSGPMVTSARLDLGNGEQFYIIGGTVWDSAAPGLGIANAWVRVNETGRTYITNAGGRFAIDRIQPGNYTLTVRAVGFREASQPIAVPQQQGGQYDIQLVHL